MKFHWFIALCVLCMVLVAAAIAVHYTSEARFINECSRQGGAPMRFRDGTSICVAPTTQMRFPTDRGPTI